MWEKATSPGQNGFSLHKENHGGVETVELLIGLDKCQFNFSFYFFKLYKRHTKNLTTHLKKNESQIWNEECQKALETIKDYLLNSPVQIPSEPEKSVLLYLLVIEDVIGSMLAQENDDKNERAVYYLSKRLHDYENKNTPIKKSFHACWVGKFHWFSFKYTVNFIFFYLWLKICHINICQFFFS